MLELFLELIILLDLKEEGRGLGAGAGVGVGFEAAAGEGSGMGTVDTDIFCVPTEELGYSSYDGSETGEGAGAFRIPSEELESLNMLLCISSSSSCPLELG